MKTNYEINTGCPLSEYPRPQMRRDSYLCLNGYWQCAFTHNGEEPKEYPEKILVPFSPETETSGISRSLGPDESLWYRRTFDLPAAGNGSRFLLHFGAVDQTAAVYVNGKLCEFHMGGYTPFTIDITPFVKKGSNELIVMAMDSTDKSWMSRGKQKTERGGIWYTPQSGIWKTVWLEAVPDVYIRQLIIRPLFDEGKLSVRAVTNKPVRVTVTAMDVAVIGESDSELELRLPAGWKPWSPEEPVLYPMQISAGNDRVESYFGMRKFAVENDAEGVPRLFLNNRPYFHTGVLDQGYYADTLLTAPCDQAMIDDITLMKSMGYNTLRKHIKIEPLRWYYHCDRLGMLVWQDMVNGGETYTKIATQMPALLSRISVNDSCYSFFGRGDETGRKQYYKELGDMLDHLVNCVSIAMWVPFNEGWGQFDAEKAVAFIEARDTTRTIDHASGWHDQRIGKTKSLHIYLRPYKFRKDRLGRAVMLTEFGGYSLREEGHCFNDKTYGYRGESTREELLKDFRILYERDIIRQKPMGLCAAIYTQLSDVEDEVNGFITFDREVVKIDPEEVRKLNEQLKD